MLVLDGIIAATEADEYILHENLVHPAFQVNSQLQDVLVIGGGDGGSVRECLQHPSVHSIELAEIDSEVIAVSQEFFPKISVGLGNSKVKIIEGDGYQHLSQLAAASKDLIILDSVDASHDTPKDGQEIISSEMTEIIYQALRPQGVAVLQLGSKWLHKEQLGQRIQIFESVFGENNIEVKEIHLPSYPTGSWSLAICQKQ